MATISTGTFGSGPACEYQLYADQIGGSGNSRTIKMTLYLKVAGSTSASWFGYAVSWLPQIHTSNGGWQAVKGGEKWYATDGFRSYEWTATVDVGTTSATSVGVYFDISAGSTNWNGARRGGSLSVGGTNTAPTMSGSVTIKANDANGATITGYCPENVSQLYISWPTGADNEQGSSGLKYGVNQIVNGGGATTILYPTTNLYCTASIGTGGEGQTLRYYVDCRDNNDALSNSITSPTITKNTLTAGQWTGHSNDVSFDTTSFTLSFAGGSNTDGSAVKYLCYSDNVTVYNQQETTTGSQVITIWRSGAVPSGPYIKFDDLKNYFASSNYNGRLHVGLRTGNNYGTYKYWSGSIGVDLRVNPNPATGHEISADAALSTSYKKIGFANTWYYIPDGSNKTRVHWNAGSGKLGESVSYELFVSYDNGQWQKITDISNNGGYHFYDHIVPKQTKQTKIKYLIRTKTSYGFYSDAITVEKDLHYYGPPQLSVKSVVRGGASADITVALSRNTSIVTGVTLGGTWQRFAKGTTTPVQETGSLADSQNNQTFKLTGLADANQYDIKITYFDNTGFSSNQMHNIPIGANLPVLFVNKYGAGVGGSKADTTNALAVNGSVKANAYNMSHGPTLGCSISRIMVEDKTSPDSLINGYAFNYGVSSGISGPILSFGSLNGVPSYPMQITGGYGDGNAFKVRVRNDDTSTWNPWRTLIHDGMFNITNPSVDSIITRTNGTSLNVKLGDDCYIGDCNLQNTFRVAGAQDSRSGFIKLGDGGTIGFDPNDAERHIKLLGRTLVHQDYSSSHHSNAQFEVRSSDRGTPRLLLHSPVRCYGSIAMDEGDLMSVVLERTGQLRIKNDYGYVRIGTVNSSYCHFHTDRTYFFMDKGLSIMGNIWCGSGYDFIVPHGHQGQITSFSNANGGGYLHVNTNTGAYGVNWWASDVKLKENISELTGKTDYINTIDKDKVSLRRPRGAVRALDIIDKIEHFSYSLLNSEGTSKCGYIANQLQEVEESFVIEVKQEPTLLSKDEEGKEIQIQNPQYFEEEPIIRNPNPSTIIPYITKAIQELSSENETLKQVNASLEQRIKAIEDMLSQ